MVNENDITNWIRARLPDDWFTEPAEITVDREEILVVGRVPEPETTESATDEGDPDGPEMRAAASGRIARFREETRDDRIAIAREAQHRFRHKVAWGATCGPVREVFTNLSVPVMTRLRQPERLVLDTLVEAGVARSRADALGWCVRLVRDNTDDWLERLQGAMTEVRRVREEGPGV